MAEEGGHEGSLWENQPWAFLNLDGDNNCGDNPAGKPEKSSKAPEGSSMQTGEETKEPPPPPPPVATTSKKRGRGGPEAGKSTGAKGGDGEAGEHEMHILTERERRKKMRNMFANLHALLPQLPQKADKSTIVDEAVNYIRALQNTLQQLQKQKQERIQSCSTFIMDPSSSSLLPSHPHHTLVPYNSREAFLADQGSSNVDNNSLIPSGKSSLNSSPQVPPIRFPVAFQTWTSPNVVLSLCGDEAQFCVCSGKKFGTLSAILFVLEKYKIEVMSVHVSSDCTKSTYMIQAHASGSHDQLMELFTVEDIYKQAAYEIMQWTSS